MMLVRRGVPSRSEGRGGGGKRRANQWSFLTRMTDSAVKGELLVVYNRIENSNNTVHCTPKPTFFTIISAVVRQILMDLSTTG